MHIPVLSVEPSKSSRISFLKKYELFELLALVQSSPREVTKFRPSRILVRKGGEGRQTMNPNFENCNDGSN